MNEQYLDFDEAVAFLKTNSSTLYKWLQSGKIPGHKLGRQWRFLRDELEMHVSGKTLNITAQQDALALVNALKTGQSNNKNLPPADTAALAEALIWDGFYQAATAIHIAPAADGHYSIAYRTNGGLKPLVDIQEAFFTALSQALQALCEPVDGRTDMRRAYLQRNEDDACMVIYQKLETRMGARLTLQLLEPYRDIPTLSRIMPQAKDLHTMTSWLQHPQGLVVISGPFGSGKTTTVLSCLAYLQEMGKVVFSLEEGTAHHLVENIHQIELQSGQLNEFEQRFTQIMASDPDVICFILNNYTNLKEAVLHAAYRAASTGHLVILHLHAPSTDAALALIKNTIPEAIDEKLLIGITSQQLIATSKGREAQFTLAHA